LLSYSKTEDKEYVKYLIGRKYNAERKYTDSERVVIGRRSESMPGMMYPNDNYVCTNPPKNEYKVKGEFA